MKMNLKRKLDNLVKEGKITNEDLKELRKDVDPWEKAEGLLKDKNIDPLDYQKKVRKEWTA